MNPEIKLCVLVDGSQKFIPVHTGDRVLVYRDPMVGHVGRVTVTAGEIVESGGVWLRHSSVSISKCYRITGHAYSSGSSAWEAFEETFNAKSEEKILVQIVESPHPSPDLEGFWDYNRVIWDGDQYWNPYQDGIA